MWWRADGTPLAVHDWDSVAVLPEFAIAGVAAAIHAGPRTPIDESAAFLAAYQQHRGRFTDDDRALARAAGLWVKLFDAKKDLVCSRDPALAEPEAMARGLLALAVRGTRRLVLRPVREAHIGPLAAVEADPATTRHVPGGPPTLERAEQRVRSAVDAWDRGKVSYWAVEVDGEIVGTAGVQAMTLHGRPCWNLYYRLAPRCWGHGYATEAAAEAIAYAARGGMPVVARIRPTNPAAQHVAVNAGLHRRADLDADGYLAFADRW